MSSPHGSGGGQQQQQQQQFYPPPQQPMQSGYAPPAAHQQYHNQQQQQQQQYHNQQQQQQQQQQQPGIYQPSPAAAQNGPNTHLQQPYQSSNQYQYAQGVPSPVPAETQYQQPPGSAAAAASTRRRLYPDQIENAYDNGTSGIAQGMNSMSIGAPSHDNNQNLQHNSYGGAPNHGSQYGNNMSGPVSVPASAGASDSIYSQKNQMMITSVAPGAPHAAAFMPYVESNNQQPYQQQQQQQQHYFQNNQQQGYVPVASPHPGVTAPGMMRPHGINAPAAPGGYNLRNKINPDDIPSPLTVQAVDQELYNNEPFRTCSRSLPPLASTRFRVIDDGNCSPRFIRPTTYNFPVNEDILNQSSMPFGFIVTPFADIPAEDDSPINVVQTSANGPTRCRRCKGYISPFVLFTDGGRKFTCNLCYFENDVSPDYYCNLDMSGRRTDILSRPELRYGSVEYVAGKEFMTHAPKPAALIIAIDVSHNAIASGLLQQITKLIRLWLYPTNGSSLFPAGAELGIITYDRTVHFYDFNPQLEKYRMLIVGDVDDMFVPISQGFLVDPAQSRQQIESFLDALPSMFLNTTHRDGVIGAVTQCINEHLATRGGKVVFYHSSFPRFGPGALKDREDSKLYQTEKERTLYQPHDPFYKTVAEASVAAGITFDLNLFPTEYSDIATLGQLSAITGGENIVYPKFNLDRDGVKVYADGMRQLTRSFGYNALMRVRVSSGLRIGEVFGNLHSSDGIDISLAGIDADKAIGFSLRYDGSLSEKADAVIQVALLYTSVDGRRLIRVHTLVLPTTNQVIEVFRFAEVDTTINYLSKVAVFKSASETLSEVRKQLVERCVKVLGSYRRYCAATSSTIQLVLPESLKLLPLFLLSLNKCTAIRNGQVLSDFRVAAMRQLYSMNVPNSITFFYPRMYALHLPETPLVRLSRERLSLNGCYLLENGQIMYLWIGNCVPPEFLDGLFGVDSLDKLDLRMHGLPELQTDINARVQVVMQSIFVRYQRALSMQIIRHGIDRFEEEMMNEMVEDNTRQCPSYVDYIIQLHRQITTELSSN